jgi:hypothetical protein
MPTPHAFQAVPNGSPPPNFNFTQLDSGVMGVAQSRARGINASGVVVGNWNSSAVDPTVLPYGFIWDATNGFRDLHGLLNPLTTWTQVTAYGINASGQICGQGLKGTAVHAFLMTPPPSGPNAPGQEKVPPPPPDPGSIPALAFIALPPSGVQNSYPVGADPLNAPALLPQAVYVSAVTADPAQAVGATFPLVQEQSNADLLFGSSDQLT